MAGPTPLRRRGLGVAIDHRSRLPARHQHQLVLVATLGQPTGREGMPKLMRAHGCPAQRPEPGRELPDRRPTASWARFGPPRAAAGGPIDALPGPRGSGRAPGRSCGRSAAPAGGGPCPAPHTIRWSRSTSSRVVSAHSARRMPVSARRRMTALSRRLVKARPSHVVRSRAMCSDPTTDYQPTGAPKAPPEHEPAQTHDRRFGLSPIS
jgi:hypothetical protein